MAESINPAVRHSKSATDVHEKSRHELQQELELKERENERLRKLLSAEEDDDIADPDMEPCNKKIIAKMRRMFSDRVSPQNVLHIFHIYDTNVLAKQDLEMVSRETDRNGETSGAILLFNRLICYPKWYQCLLKVLCDPTVKMTHLANKMVEWSGIPYEGDNTLDDNLESQEAMETNNSSGTFLKDEMAGDTLFSDGCEETDGDPGHSESVQGAASQNYPPCLKPGTSTTMVSEQGLKTSSEEHWQQQVAMQEGEINSQNQQYKDTIMKMENDLAVLKQGDTSQIAEPKANDEASKRTIEILERQLGEERAERMSMASKYEVAQKAVHQQRGEIDRLQKEVQSAKAEADELRRQQADHRHIESQSQIRFEAKMPAGSCVNITKHETIRCMKEIVSDTENAYDSNTGIYTVAVSGWYKVKLAQYQRKDGRGRIVLHGIHEKSNALESERPRAVVATETMGRERGPRQYKQGTEHAVKMMVGDRLWVAVAALDENEKLIAPSSISCIYLAPP